MTQLAISQNECNKRNMEFTKHLLVDPKLGPIIDFLCETMEDDRQEAKESTYALGRYDLAVEALNFIFARYGQKDDLKM